MCNLFSKLKGFIIILLLMASQGCSREERGSPPTFADPKTASDQALVTFRKLITKDNYKDLGFDSVEEVGGAQLGAPLAIFFVRLDRLRDYQPGSDPNTLLTDGAQVYYPVLVKEQVRAAIVVEMANGTWKATRLGNAGLAKQISQVQRDAASPAVGSEPDMIVQVPALGIYFIGRRGADKKLTLIPFATEPRYKLRTAAEQSADEVFATLAPFAKSFSGLPK